MLERDKNQLLRILEESYVLDMYTPREDGPMSDDFHAEFRMLIPSFDGRTGEITELEWQKPDAFASPPQPRGRQPNQRFTMEVLDITGKVAVCKVEAIREGRLCYTDYVTFVRIGRTWKIVSKAFHRHASVD